VLLSSQLERERFLVLVNSSVARRVVNGPVKMARPTDRLTI
jgi:hypothetical protein